MNRYQIKTILKVFIETVVCIIVFNCLSKYYNSLSNIKNQCYVLIILVIGWLNINAIFELINFKKEKNKKLFNIYYINYQKVFEICMLIDNTIKEKAEISYKNEQSDKQSVGFKSEINKSMKLSPMANLENSTTKTYEYKEMQEIKNTNSTYLSKIIDVCKNDDLNDLENGRLIKINNVILEIVNKNDIAQVNSMLSGVFNGNTIPTDSDGQTFNLNINAITNILLKDYKYNLKGTCEGLGEFYISIPIKAEKEFENDYSIYDLEIGKVNIIGIYRTDKYKCSSGNNTFDYLVGIGNQENHIGGDELKSSTPKTTSKKDKNVKKELPYIDLIAIVQDLEISGGNIDE